MVHRVGDNSRKGGRKRGGGEKELLKGTAIANIRRVGKSNTFGVA